MNSPLSAEYASYLHEPNPFQDFSPEELHEIFSEVFIEYSNCKSFQESTNRDRKIRAFEVLNKFLIDLKKHNKVATVNKNP